MRRSSTCGVVGFIEKDDILLNEMKILSTVRTTKMQGNLSTA
jgi:hypothetical protein